MAISPDVNSTPPFPGPLPEAVRFQFELAFATETNELVRAVEARLRQVVKNGLDTARIRIVEDAAAPLYYAVVEARVLKTPNNTAFTAVRVDTTLRENATVTRNGRNVTVDAETWGHRPEIGIFLDEQNLEMVYTFAQLRLNHQMSVLLAPATPEAPISRAR